MRQTKYVAKTLMGLEPVLSKELEALGASNIEIGKRVVKFEGPESLLYRATYCLRTAIRVLKPINKFRFHTKKDFFNKVFRFKWDRYFENSKSIAIDSIVHSRFFSNSNYVSQLTKDGICDYFIKKTGQRPNVELKKPDVRIHLHIYEDTAEISLDSSGYSLHLRSYKTERATAPLSEVLAAGMIQLSDWQVGSKFIDPMCGSGTIPIEAAMLAYNIPAQKLNTRFSFQNWREFNQELYLAERKSADDQINNLASANVEGGDMMFRNAHAAQKNADNILGERAPRFKKSNFFDYKDMSEYHLLINPPYDLRLHENDIKRFYQNIGDTLKKQWTNSTAWILSGNVDAIKSLGLKTSRRIHLINGQIPCKFHKFEMYTGTKRVKNDE